MKVERDGIKALNLCWVSVAKVCFSCETHQIVLKYFQKAVYSKTTNNNRTGNC